MILDSGARREFGTGAIWTHKNKPELIDLPFAKENKKC